MKSLFMHRKGYRRSLDDFNIEIEDRLERRYIEKGYQ